MKHVKTFESFRGDLIELIEHNGKFINDYYVDEYDEIKDAIRVDIYQYGETEYHIANYLEGSEKAHIGQEIIKEISL